jgi:mitogen-activated protein kinase 7
LIIVDVWSVGCIFGEILGRKVLFKGRDHVDQLNKILGLLGLPKDISFWDPSESVLAHIQSICTADGLPPPVDPIDFNILLPSSSTEAIDILKGLLQLNPKKRLNVEQALRYPFLYSFADPLEESLLPPPVLPHQYNFEQINNDTDLKNMVIQEVKSFKQQHQERESKQDHQNGDSDISPVPRRYHTVAADAATYGCATPTHKLDYLPSATMSLFEHPTINETDSKDSAVYTYENTLVLEPEELGDDDNYSYLCELINATPGVSIQPYRQFREPVHGDARANLERALTGTW